MANYTFRERALCYSLPQGPALESYENNITDAITWANARTHLITRLSDGGKKFRYRIEVKHCITGDGKEIGKFLHQIKTSVDERWPDDMELIAPYSHGAEKTAQARQNEKDILITHRKQLNQDIYNEKHKNVCWKTLTWNKFSTQIIQTDASFQVSSNFLNEEEQTKDQMVSLEREMKNLQSELQEHLVNAAEESSRPVDSNQRRK